MTHSRRRSRKRSAWEHALDWFAVFVATASFIFVALWAAAPDSAKITFEQATYRAFSYAVPITAGMWGITRAMRKGSAVPPSMAEAMPYARLGKDGKPLASTAKDDADGVDPQPMSAPSPVRESTEGTSDDNR